MTGFIEPCVGVSSHRMPYAAGTVVALRGVERLRPIRAGEEQVVLPTAVAARQHVNQNQRFRFVLAPGPYVLVATYAESGAGRTFLDLRVTSGATVQQNLRDICK